MKALIGSWEHRPYRVLAEVTALRARVAELEGTLKALREENDELHADNQALRADNQALRAEIARGAEREIVLNPS